MFCSPAGSAANLAQCQAALTRDRQANLAFDSAIRAAHFSGSAGSDARQLLDDDGKLENLLLQAAASTSLSGDTALFAQISQLYQQASADANRLRADLGLSPTTPPASQTAG